MASARGGQRHTAPEAAAKPRGGRPSPRQLTLSARGCADGRTGFAAGVSARLSRSPPTLRTSWPSAAGCHASLFLGQLGPTNKNHFSYHFVFPLFPVVYIKQQQQKKFLRLPRALCVSKKNHLFQMDLASFSPAPPGREILSVLCPPGEEPGREEAERGLWGQACPTSVKWAIPGPPRPG